MKSIAMTTKGEGEDEDEVLGSSSQWRDSGVDTLIALHEEMEPKFVQNGKKKDKLYCLAKCQIQIGQLGPLSWEDKTLC